MNTPKPSGPHCEQEDELECPCGAFEIYLVEPKHEYEYQCENCDLGFDAPVLPFSEFLDCPKCHSRDVLKITNG